MSTLDGAANGISSEFCSTCHKVHLDVPVNKYRWFRGFNDYDNWQASGVSGQGARSFYYPEKSSTCVDCHMPTVATNGGTPIRLVARQRRWAAERGGGVLAEYDLLGRGKTIVGVNALLEREPDISDEDLLDVLASNLCRCTGYQNIVKAIQYAAAKINGVEFQEAAE